MMDLHLVIIRIFIIHGQSQIIWIKRKIGAYWAATSSNTLINSLIQQSATDMKEKMEILLQEKEILVTFDEQIVFEQLQQDKKCNLESAACQWISESVGSGSGL